MIFLKDYYYSATGRPDFYDTGNPYEADQEPIELANFPQTLAQHYERYPEDIPAATPDE